MEYLLIRNNGVVVCPFGGGALSSRITEILRRCYVKQLFDYKGRYPDRRLVPDVGWEDSRSAAEYRRAEIYRRIRRLELSYRIPCAMSREVMQNFLRMKNLFGSFAAENWTHLRKALHNVSKRIRAWIHSIDFFVSKGRALHSPKMSMKNQWTRGLNEIQSQGRAVVRHGGS